MHDRMLFPAIPTEVATLRTLTAARRIKPVLDPSVNIFGPVLVQLDFDFQGLNGLA